MFRGVKPGTDAVGAKPVATLFVSPATIRAHQELPERMLRKARMAGQKLVA